MLVPALELGGDDIYVDELLPPLVRGFSEVFVVRHTTAQGTCELVDDNIDHCPIWYFGVRVLWINFVKVILN